MIFLSPKHKAAVWIWLIGVALAYGVTFDRELARHYDAAKQGVYQAKIERHLGLPYYQWHREWMAQARAKCEERYPPPARADMDRQRGLFGLPMDNPMPRYVLIEQCIQFSERPKFSFGMLDWVKAAVGALATQVDDDLPESGLFLSGGYFATPFLVFGFVYVRRRLRGRWPKLRIYVGILFGDDEANDRQKPEGENSQTSQRWPVNRD